MWYKIVVGDCAVVGWTAVHICTRRPADGNVPLQVQTDAPDTHVQRPQASHLLPLQHCQFAAELSLK